MPPPKFKKLMAKGTKQQDMSCCKKFVKVLFSHGGLFILVSLYACLGAWLYCQIELPFEDRRRSKKKRVTMDMDDALNYLINYLWFLNGQTMSNKDYRKEVFGNLDVLKTFVVAKGSDGMIQYDGHMDTWEYDWTFPKSLLFTVTSMAAIGYGHISPKTLNGRLFTIIYNVIGIPLLLVFLANIGDFLANSFRFIYSRLCCRWCRWRRRVNEKKKKEKPPHKRELWQDDVGYETYMPTEKVDVPIVVNLCVVTAYLVLGGFLFGWWEEWDLISAVYFTFITLTTVGFGDLVPGNSFLDTSEPIRAALKMLATVLFCLFGMSVLSMCINLMQEQLVAKARWFAMEVGIIEEDIDPQTKYKYKKSKKGTVMETHPDRDGNKKLSLLNAEEGESTSKTQSKVITDYEDFDDF